jgi:hypothetical protein
MLESKFYNALATVISVSQEEILSKDTKIEFICTMCNGKTIMKKKYSWSYYKGGVHDIYICPTCWSKQNFVTVNRIIMSKRDENVEKYFLSQQIDSLNKDILGMISVKYILYSWFTKLDFF